jgi:hypothetical protein
MPKNSDELEIIEKTGELLSLARKVSTSELPETPQSVKTANTEPSVDSPIQVELEKTTTALELQAKDPTATMLKLDPSGTSSETAAQFKTLELSQAEPDLSSLDIVVDKHLPRMLPTKEQLPPHSQTAQEEAVSQTGERSPKGSMFKYYGNHQFVGVAKADSQGDLSALVNFLDQQPQHKQARFVDAAIVGNNKEEKATKSPIYIRQNAEIIPEIKQKSEDPLKKIPEKFQAEEIMTDSETIAESKATKSTTHKSEGMNRAGYSYSGFDFYDRYCSVYSISENNAFCML